MRWQPDAKDEFTPVGSAPEKKRLDLIWAGDVVLDIDKPGLVDGLLDTASMAVVYGESGSGKTFVTVDLACRIAAGLPWNGLATNPGVVIYIAAEAPKTTTGLPSLYSGAAFT